MTQFRRLSPAMLVSPQIAPEDLEEAEAEGVKLVVNNRPDGEEPDAPQSDAIEAAARAKGMDYLYLPITHSGISSTQIDALGTALQSVDGATLGYCRSGTRSTMVWALAQVKLGQSPDDVADAAGAAGYDVTPIRPMMDMIAAR